MGIEELEEELKETKAEAYDLNGKYIKLIQRIDAVTDEIEKLKENSNQKTIQSEDVIQEPVQEEVKAEVTPIQVENQISEEAVAIAETVNENSEVPVEETTETAVVTPIAPQENPVQETAEVVVPQAPVEETTETAVVTPIEQPAPVQENAEAATVTPIASTDVKIEIPGQSLNQPPLAPSVEIQGNPETKTSNVVYTKTDTEIAKAILVTNGQMLKLRKSKGLNKALTFEENKAVSESKEELNKQLETMYDELRTITNEEEAKEKNKEIAELTKRLELAA